MITIYIIDDHPLVSEGIATMLKDVSHLEIIGTAKTGKESLEYLEQGEPDIILLDISLPDMDGMEICSEIRKKNKTAKIIGLTSTNETGIITQFLTRGGNGYLLKNMERDELIKAIDIVLSGKTFLSQAANEKLLEQFHSVNDAMRNTPVLTRREKEILQLLNDGLSGPQIAEKLFLSHHTIESHRKNMLQKFNVTSTPLLLKTARDSRLIN